MRLLDSRHHQHESLRVLSPTQHLASEIECALIGVEFAATRDAAPERMNASAESPKSTIEKVDKHELIFTSR